MSKTRLATALFAAAALASAQPGMMRRPDPLVAAIDTDNDRTISAAELGKAASALAPLDTNKDGQLSADEMRPQFGGGFGRGDGRGPRGGGGGEAAAGSGDQLKTLMAFDANGDGQLAKSEVPERMQGLFTRGDKNNDGVLSSAELQALVAAQPRPGNQGPPPAGMDPVRAALDTDGDGTISTAEMSAAPTSLAKLDRNSDGVLSEDELRPATGGGGRGGPRGNPEEMYKRMLEENDANGDGKLAVSELPERMRQFMGNADANKDGFISQEEMMSARPQGGPGGPRGRREE